MKNKAFLIVLFGCFWVQVRQIIAQPNTADADKEIEAFQYARSLLHDSLRTSRDYVKVLNLLVKRQDYHAFRDYLDYMAAAFIYAGHVEKATELGDKAFPQKKTAANLDFEQYKLQNALPLLLAKAAEKQVVMVNEEHRTPRHRLLTVQLLKPLYEKGFRYLAVEALYGSEIITKRQHLGVFSGFYIRDPVFAEMLREALALGYQLVPYDVSQTPPNLKPLERTLYREDGQARNIAERILAQDPQAKIIVHGGRDHMAKIFEKQPLGADSVQMGMMAGFFQHRTGIQVFSIDQMRHEQHSDSLYESSVFRWLRRTSQRPLPLFSLLTEKANGQWHSLAPYYDAYVVPSPVQYEKGRPNWLRQWPGRKKYVAKVRAYKPIQGEYFIVQAFYGRENPDLAIPADQYAYTAGTQEVHLYLKPGNYQLRLLNAEGKILKEWTQTIKP